MRQEPVLEPIARHIRFQKTLKKINGHNIVIVDIGCGPNIAYYNYLQKKGIRVNQYVGLDPLIKDNVTRNPRIKLINNSYNELLPLKSESVDYVVAHAVLEHVNDPKKFLLEMYRVVRPDGKILLTTPTPIAKYVLEFLAYKLNLISKREILEHKNYFNKERLFFILKNLNNVIIKHRYFEFGMNNFIEIIKYKQ